VLTTNVNLVYAACRHIVTRHRTAPCPTVQPLRQPMPAHATGVSVNVVPLLACVGLTLQHVRAALDGGHAWWRIAAEPALARLADVAEYHELMTDAPPEP
jgi:hypothetical protein